MDRPEIPPEPEVSERFWIPSVEHHATAIGYICIEMATVEFQVDRLLGTLLDIPEPLLRAIVTKTGSLDNRIELLRHVAMERSPSNDWQSRLATELDALARSSSERNRVVHDVWIDADVPTQYDRRSKGARDRHQPLGKKLLPSKNARSLEYLWSLHRRILNHGTGIRVLQIQCLFPHGQTPPQARS